jgi:sn-glycerol 3-phosphate transport system substrate-binding protein
MRFAGLLRSTLAGLVCSMCAVPAYAVTEIEVWHTMTGVSADTFGSLVERFNSEQKAVHVNLVFKGRDDAALVASAIAAMKTERQHRVVRIQGHRSADV